MLVHDRAAGFTLIEILVALAILLIALTLGLQGVTGWLQNAQIRTAAESIQNGLRTARIEALRRNAFVEFVLSAPATRGGTGWTIREVNTAAVIQATPDAVGSPNAILTVVPQDATTVTFNGFGRVAAAVNGDGSASLQSIAIDSTALSAGESRDLRLLIPAGGGVRMCDPNVTNSLDPRKC